MLAQFSSLAAFDWPSLLDGMLGKFLTYDPDKRRGSYVPIYHALFLATFAILTVGTNKRLVEPISRLFHIASRFLNHQRWCNVRHEGTDCLINGFDGVLQAKDVPKLWRRTSFPHIFMGLHALQFTIAFKVRESYFLTCASEGF